MKRSSLAVFVPKSNPLSQKEQISFSDLRSESFIALSADVDSEYILLLNRLAAEAGFIPRISCYIPNENSFKINLIMGNGVVLADSACALENEYIKKFEFPDKPNGTVLAWKTKNNVGKVDQLFDEII